MKKLMLHKVIDVIATFVFIVAITFLEIYTIVSSHPRLFQISISWIASVPLAIVYFVKESARLILIFIDIKSREPQTIITKGYSKIVRHPVYILQISEKLMYSVVTFCDVRLKGKYIYLENDMYQDGDELEITYYPRSKYITSIKLLSRKKTNK